MAGINQDIVFATAQIETTFADDVGNRCSGSGTGFFLRANSGAPTFVTNRHNLDPLLNVRAKNFGPSMKLKKVALRLRRYEPGGEHTADTDVFVVDLNRCQVKHSAGADVSVIVRPEFESKPSAFGFNCVTMQDLATQDFLTTHVAMADLVTFVGYPGGRSGSPWWDTKWNTAIGRLAGLASRPDVSFTNRQVATADITLVSGLSFHGSSGSPVILHVKPAPPMGYPGHYAPATVLGIMSGHWWEDESEAPELLRHSGLSYFTRATAIRALVEGL